MQHNAVLFGLVRFAKYKPQIKLNNAILLINDSNTSELNKNFYDFGLVWFGLRFSIGLVQFWIPLYKMVSGSSTNFVHEMHPDDTTLKHVSIFNNNLIFWSYYQCQLVCVVFVYESRFHIVYYFGPIYKKKKKSIFTLIRNNNEVYLIF